MAANTSTRELIVEISIRHFAQKGYAAVNLMDIAREAGITRGPLYYYFANKAELYVACVHRVLESSQASYEAILSSGKPVLEVIRDDMRFCLADDGLLQRMGSGSKDEPDCSSEVAAFQQWLLSRKIRLFTEARERGELPENCDPMRLATYIYIYYYGVRGTRVLARTVRGFDDAMLDQAADALIDAICSVYPGIRRA